MTTIQVQKERWANYFAAVGESLQGLHALVEVAALPLGDQIAAKWIPLRGISYDRKDDIVDLDLGDLDHVIRHPTAISVLTDVGRVSAIEVVDDQKVKHIVRLREPLLLPPPT